MQVCRHCGKQSRPNDMFCMHCGQRLEAATQAPAPAMAYNNGAADGKSGGWLRTQPVKAVSVTQDIARRPTSPAAPTPAAEPAPAARPTPMTGPFARLLLVASGGQDTSSEFPLDGRNVTIGRAPACTVSVPDDQLASRLHAMLHYEADHYTITDLGSSNGTLVNGVKIRSATPLAEGDRITVGQHVFVFTAAPAPAPSAAPAPDQPAATESAAPAASPVEAPAADGFRAVATAADEQADAAPTVVEAPAPSDDAADATAADAPAASPAASAPLPTDAFFGAPGSGDLPSEPPTTPAITVAPGTDALKQLQAQLMETSATLASWTASATAHTKQLRTALAELAARVYSDLSAIDTTLPGGYGANTSALDDLIQIATQAAADPQHVNSLTALAARCQDVATVLKNQQAVIATLVMVRDRLDQLAQTEGW